MHARDGIIQRDELSVNELLRSVVSGLDGSTSGVFWIERRARRVTVSGTARLREARGNALLINVVDELLLLDWIERLERRGHLRVLDESMDVVEVATMLQQSSDVVAACRIMHGCELLEGFALGC